MDQQKTPQVAVAKSRRYRAGIRHDLAQIKAELSAFRRDFEEVTVGLHRRATSAQEHSNAD